jgi:hypothetical protein
MFNRKFKARDIIKIFEQITSYAEDEHHVSGDVSVKVEIFAFNSDEETTSHLRPRS